jgi:Tol biopolymer transport system component
MLSTITPSAPEIRYQSLAIEIDVPSEYELEGVLVLDINDWEAMDYLLSLYSWEEIPLATVMDSGVLLTDWTWPAVSPDRKWLAYLEQFYDPTRRELRVVSSSGQQQIIDNWKDNWSGDIIGWLDNQYLLVAEFFDMDHTVDVFDPFSGEWQELKASFPHTSPNGEVFGASGSQVGPMLVYDPARNTVLYERYLRDQDKSTYELWDIQSKEILWERSIGGIASRPVWSPNGTRFAVIYLQHSESYDPTLDYGSLYLVTADGHETKLIDRVAGELAWSPDGRFLATWWRGDVDFDIELPDRWTNSLVIVDLFTNGVTIYSVGNASSDQHPVWSPDGDMVAMVSYREAEEPVDDIPTRVVILDIDGNRAFEIVKEASVRGWMTPAP